MPCTDMKSACDSANTVTLRRRRSAGAVAGRIGEVARRQVRARARCLLALHNPRWANEAIAVDQTAARSWIAISTICGGRASSTGGVLACRGAGARVYLGLRAFKVER